jgi:alkanesulfonate monooxygenase SsuD/methylene tetrahydromethanopterin reductase-like flavin-dependent oxidoreductase (luciferase family)
MAGQVPFGLAYMFGNAPEWRQPWVDRYRATLDQIAWVDQELLFDGVYVSEHHFFEDGYMPAPLVMCAAIAMRTERVSIGTDLIQLPLSHPVTVAEEALVLDILSGGRMRLGVGQGFYPQEFDGHGVSVRERASRTEESIEILRAAFSGEPFSYAGKKFQLPRIEVTPGPIRPGGPPIWMGALADVAVERAARLADGFLAFDPATAGKYLDACKRLGRPKHEQRLNRTAWAVIADDPERAFADAGKHWLHVLNAYIVRGGLGPGVAPYEDPQKALADGLILLADASQAIKEFNGYIAAGAIDITLFTFWSGEDVDAVSERLQYMSDEVIPNVDKSDHPALEATARLSKRD